MLVKIGVALSGGVDSAVAAAILKAEGHDVVGYHMKNLPDTLFELVPEKKKVCCSPSDTIDTHKIAAKLGIELRIVKLNDIFRKEIIDYFIREYQAGKTPNPCVRCNDLMKFGALMEKAFGDGMEKFASGHYARIVEHPKYGLSLARGVAKYKDQAYFLSRIKRRKLPYIIFPNGNMTKEEIRDIARELGLPVHSKKESQELCFIPDNDYRRFLLEEGIEIKPGEIVDLEGNVLGRHKGLAFYTVGQRRGLGIVSDKKLYVVALDADKNRVVVGPKEAVMRKKFRAIEPNWLADLDEKELRCQCQIRSNMKAQGATIRIFSNIVEVEFDKPALAITPGQLAVFYDGNIVLGSAFIENVVS
ncbi:tRNA 2-thiouridine(34) synthase MnmA [Kosmotoga olearia]|uniref:tRNA-specific 2-thiouridylase MnmA n=1 Tax=Kosmotoga olearia (strain ATCC BAA-1733 / DSM 21960 / TBF 19.5.1) TaxID=521045 RepID=C5CIB3_KOSOT|nr:tRNA 2-thiouridine(34) synthase MnmA [Kosmotoga olearia]ACR78847.1 tRNA (5-methylaminomethyl-2-thiouridylate)-methyltransferase [Kosmotoga olearia TBF 19.5.1]MDK2954379.1 tRNA-uridine 2-sulfurtransferase [Kosmotoga sp.]